ncbi:hypothetical protein [Delftia tsuruhatensis]|uniref:hypothetical protein n=1 Tax=Delftia tsuruhatensis TaxID=180282 RepID=UPI002AD4B1EA|nr:hypothetical protein [Delftia tsuruhatensis]WQM80342.1 hypothetical protein RNT40_16605 [Delftia tsuruhatensis]
MKYQLTGENFVYRWDGDVRMTIPLTEGSTHADEYRAWLAAGGVPLPAELRPAAEIAAELRQALTAEYDTRIQVIAAGYPLSERESWSVQTQEARALEADPAVAAPWIDAAAQARGLGRLELAARIRAKDAGYRQMHGLLTGTRRRIEDQIDAAADDALALSQIDVAAGWPSLT